MAVTINGSTNNSNWTYKLVANENSTSVANNTSSVTVTAYIGRTSSRSYLGGNWSGSITVNGSTQSASGTISYPTYIDGGSWLQLYSKTFTVAHNSDGSKTTSISSSFNSSDFTPSSASASGSMTLTTIPRKATITSGTDFTDETNPTINFSNPGNFNLEPYINFWKNGTLVLSIKRSIAKYSSPYKWNLTDNERNSIREFMSSENSWNCTEGLNTYNGSTSLGYHSVVKKCTIVNASPIFEDFNYEDINTRTLALTNNSQVIVKGYSTLQATIPTNYKAAAQKYATMSKYKLDNFEANYSSSEAVTLPEIANYSKDTITVQAIDSRGNSTAKTYTLDGTDFVNYDSLTKGNITLTRSNNGVGELVTLTYNGTWWNDNFGVVQNNISATYKYKKTNDTNWSTGVTTINPVSDGNSYSYTGQIAGDTEQHGFEVDDSYDIEVIVEDSLSTVTFSAILGAGKPAIAVYRNKVALGDKYDTSLGGIQLWGDVYVNGNRIS